MIISLDGQWQLATDPDNQGREQAWFKKSRTEAVAAAVPYPIQEYFPAYHGVVWYWHTFDAPPSADEIGTILLRFWAVDYMAEVWLNGVPVGGHEGSETPFSLDVTQVIQSGTANLLAVRVLNPTNEPIDGIILAETPHRNKTVPHYVGGSYNVGGIIESVELVLTPVLWIEDLHLQPDPATGIITVTALVNNTAAESRTAQLTWVAEPSAGGESLATAQLSRVLPAGQTEIATQLTILQPRLWDLHDPYLYRITLQMREVAPAVTEQPPSYDQRSARCGFRDFRVADGFFQLNGRRIFLRSTHTGNHTPIGQVIDSHEAPDLLRRDLLLAKTLGFNMVRFISAVAHPWQLDACDEMGLMVYEESYAAWLLKDSPHMARRFDQSVREMVLRDRNHPCITVWGMLNETKDGPVFKQAVACLALVRSLDLSRLVLLSSGRWDAQPSIGSVSNPGSTAWEHEWGGEAPNAPNVPATWSSGILAYIQDAGDFHAYPPVPHPPEVIHFLRTVGENSKPVFISEYGIGSTLNAIREFRLYEQHGMNLKAEDAVLMRGMADQFIADWDRYGMAGAYAFPEDMLQASQRLHARQRLVGFDAIRANPKICGYNLTGMLDHGMTGEGAWTFWRELKPGIADALSDGWAPLRWCLFIEPMHIYSGRTFELAVVLANEDVLPAGHYPVRIRIVGQQGVVWETEASVQISEATSGKANPLAQSVLKAKVTLDVPTGTYELVANMTHGAAPVGGRLTFHVSQTATLLPAIHAMIQHWGVSETIITWLAEHNTTSTPFDASSKVTPKIILVGDVSSTESSGTTLDAQWAALLQQVSAGASAIFLLPETLKQGEATLGRLPPALSNRLKFSPFHDYLYHKECVAKVHAVFDGLPAAGIMDWDFYGPVIPKALIIDQAVPEDVAAAAFAMGYTTPSGYTSGLIVSTYAHGQGQLVLSTLQLLNNINTHPAADQLLLNLIQVAGH